ncbi:MAG: outer membrane protein assembly factor BamA [Bacteroidota bacterium]|nr:outer membrane protein assembly factor BamA [Bacteroidota bacterium]
MLKRLFISIAFIINGLFVFAQSGTNSQPSIINYAEPKEYSVADVKISGVQFLDTKTLLLMSGITVGKKITVPGDDISKVIDKYWKHGLFSDVKVLATKIVGDSIWLDIQLKERPRLSKFTITGVKKSDVTDITEKLGIKSGDQVNDNLVNNIVTYIKKHYWEKGYWNTKVTITQTKDTLSSNKVFLNAAVNKDKKVKIASIDFVDNKQFDSKRLRRVLKKTHAKSWNIFKSSKFVESNFKEDKKKLEEFFAKNGYRDYKLVKDSISVVSKNRIALHLKVHEGNQYHIRSITWLGNTKYPNDILDKVLVLKKSDVYDQVALKKRLSQDDDAVSSLYLDNGYLFSNVEAVEANVEKDSVDLEMHIVEGQPATIKNIIILGNTKTNEHVVRRELYTRPGDLFSKSEIVNSVRMLSQLGHFNPEKIEPVPLPNPSDGTVDIQYKLEEKANDQLEVSGGWGGNMLVGTIGLRFNNFSARNLFNGKAWRPVPSGDGQQLAIRAQTNGSYYKAYNMSFTEPWFGGKKPNSFTFSLYHTVQNSGSTSLLKSSNQSFKVSGASVGLGRRLHWPDRNFSLYNEVSFQNYNLKNWISGYFLFNDGDSKNFSFKTSFSRSDVDQAIYPRRGSTFSLTLQLTPPYSKFKSKEFWVLHGAERNVDNIAQTEKARRYSWIEYHKWTYKGVWYNELAKNLVLSFNSQFGYLGYYSSSLGPSPFEGFTLGGDGYSGYNVYGRETIGLRGYENESLTPTTFSKENSSYVKVANVYTKMTLELRYPLTLQPSSTIYGLAFLEGGRSWTKFEEFNPFAVKRSAGVGVRAFLPMFGMLGIDWGYGFDKAPGSNTRSGSQFHFVMGQQF